ncbi:TonB-dependent receptor [Sporomusa sp.]|uniref:TonB-dependent receptor plug domain-containing protein n=1 Tax=Sporomusa sp. TaxID=2078658 RepID=UPI002BDE56C4|nr:TonB-dependent receptor [Sporomusa sp.]HWR07620.1 TonB-dependent receptor [Sporomusa sp.]
MINSKQKKILCSLISSALLFGMTGLASAEEAEQEYNFDEYVVTANRIPVKATEVAANVTVITGETIEKGGFTRISDVLRDNNINTGSTSFGAFPVLNGDDRVLVLVDGRKMNWPHLMFSGNDHVVNIDGISVKNIERIEILRGPGSSLYGSDAVGGVVNIITKKAEGNRTSIASEFGNWGFKRYNLTTEGKTDDISYFFTAEQKKRDNFEYKEANTGKNKTHAASQLDQDLMTLRLDKELGNGKDISLQWEHTNDQTGFGAALMEDGNAANPEGRQDLTSNNLALTYRWNQDSGAGNFVRVYRNTSTGTLYKSLVKTDGVSPYSYDLYANGVEWQQNWKLSEKQTLVGGASWLKEHLDDQDTINRGVSTKSVFLENSWRLPSKWLLTVGTRYDDQSIVGDNTTSRLSINREINATTNIYASWGQYVRNPTVAQLFSNTIYWVGNSDLKPEEGNTVTIGLNTELGDGTKLQTSVYSSHLKNAIQWKSLWPDPGYYENVDREKRQGLDITLNKTLSPQWDVTAGYSYAQIKTTANSTNYYDDPKNSQPNGYHLGFNYNQDKWDAGLTLRAATNRSLEKFTSKSYLTMDMTVNYQITPTTRIYANAYNLTNEAYELIGNVWYKPGSYPMAGRNFFIGMEHRM